MPLCPPQTPHAAQTRTRTAAVGSQRVTAWATARPNLILVTGKYIDALVRTQPVHYVFIPCTSCNNTSEKKLAQNWKIVNILRGVHEINSTVLGSHTVVVKSSSLFLIILPYLSLFFLLLPLRSIRHPWNASFHFSFLILGQSLRLLGRKISPSEGRYLHRTTQTQNKRTQTSMPRVRFEPTIAVFERAKAVLALDRAATVTGALPYSSAKTSLRLLPASCWFVAWHTHKLSRWRRYFPQEHLFLSLDYTTLFLRR
jgi:hypothetical protein